MILYFSVIIKILPEATPGEYLSACGEFSPGTKRSVQVFENVPPDQPNLDPIGRPLVHYTGLEQCTGEANFTADIPDKEGIL